MVVDYVLANPSGNITALVTAPVAQADKAKVVSEIFDNEPTCEQVGFVEFLDENSIALEMMGGEFCGHATISSAAYVARSYNMPVYEDMYVNVHVSCLDEPLKVYVLREKDVEDEQAGAASLEVKQHKYRGTVMMPKPELSELHGYPIVLMDGIAHMIVPSSEMSHEEAEQVVRKYASEIDTLALGIMLYEEGGSSGRVGGTNGGQANVSIQPLVYVKGSDTIFWENGCATGSTALGYYRYVKEGVARSDVSNPGGVITIKILGGVPQLTGNIIL